MQICINHLTRGSPKQALNSLYSLYYASRYREKLKFLIILDSDDKDSISFFTTGQGSHFPCELHITERKPWPSFHMYFNEVLCDCNSDWWIPWSDDCIMLTDGWDEILLKAERFGHLLICFEDVSRYGRRHPNQCLGFAIHKNLYKVLGAFEHHAVDSYLAEVGSRTGVLSIGLGIDIYHSGMDEPFRSINSRKRDDSLLVNFDPLELKITKQKIRQHFSFIRRFYLRFLSLRFYLKLVIRTIWHNRFF